MPVKKAGANKRIETRILDRLPDRAGGILAISPRDTGESANGQDKMEQQFNRVQRQA